MIDMGRLYYASANGSGDGSTSDAAGSISDALLYAQENPFCGFLIVDSIISADNLIMLDAATEGPVDASGVTTLTGAAADVATAITPRAASPVWAMSP